MDFREASLLSEIIGREVDAAEPGCQNAEAVPPSYAEAIGKAPGIVLLDKPTGPTSHDMVSLIRRTITRKLRAAGSQTKVRVGHSGTLDPAASGLLVMGVGRGTKLLPYLHGLDKGYEATVRLGLVTDTDDLEGEAIAPEITEPDVGLEAVAAALEGFRGDIRQRAPLYSAIKRGGRSYHAMAREGTAPEPPLRDVETMRLDLIGLDGRDVRLSMTVSAGFYVRSLARDLGEALSCGGVLAGLRRVRVGPFDVADAMVTDDVNGLEWHGP